MRRIIEELCPKCGQQAARQNDDGTVSWLAHRCPHGPPGPPDYPKRFQACEVVFVPRPLTIEEAEAALDASQGVPLSEERIQEIVEYATGKRRRP